MNILITGIAGFIGFHVARCLLAEGHEVCGVDNLCDNGDLEMKLKRLELLGIGADCLGATTAPVVNGKLRFLRVDLTDRERTLSLCQGKRFDQLIHLAAITGIARSRREPSAFFDNNVAATQHVLEAARLGGVQHVFFSSSAVVHGAHAHAPQSEEDDVDTPLNIYAGSKRAAEILCYAYSQSYNLPITVFRFFTAFGPWSRPDSVPMQLARDIIEERPIRVINNGYLVRDFTYVDDITDGMLAAIASPPVKAHGAPPYALYNIGRSKPVSLLTFIQALETAFGCCAHVELDPTDPVTQGSPVENYADTSKLERQLAYSPVWDYEEAVPCFAEWFRDNYGKSFTM